MVILLSAQQISKSFSGKSLFENISFGIAEGDRVGLLGPNGAGKSTLLKIIAGKMTADSGEVVRRRGMKLGYLEQSPSFERGQTLFEALGSKLEHPNENVGVVYEWLSKLDLLQFGEDFQANRLSGGWQKRLALGRELVADPDLLLLDEPTNHLDIPSILWLEAFLDSQTNMARNLTLLTVTHDRLFLQRTCKRIFDLDFRNPKGLLVIEGEYLKYVEAKENLMAQQKATEDKVRNTLRRETEWLRRGAQARQTKQKARIENANELGQNLKDLSKKNASYQIQMDFGNPLKQPKKLIELRKVCFSYGVESNEGGEAKGAQAATKSMFQDLNILITPKTRLGLIGSNGVGKTTFIKLLLGQLSPISGEVFFAENLEVSYFEQTKEGINLQLSVLENICPQGDYVHFQGQFVFARSYLDRFRFTRDKMDLPASQLSGGEIARLRIAQMMLTKAGVLILDEPTNDLDLETLGVLEQALADFQGGIVLISHDRYFMDQVANEILSIENPQGSPRTMTTFADYIQWEEWFALREQNLKTTEKPTVKFTDGIQDKLTSISQPNTKTKVKITFKDRQDWQTIESEISDLENKIKNFEEQLFLPEVATNGAKLTEICQQLEKSKHLLEIKYQRWEFLAELMQQEKATEH